MSEGSDSNNTLLIVVGIISCILCIASIVVGVIYAMKPEWLGLDPHEKEDLPLGADGNPIEDPTNPPEDDGREYVFFPNIDAGGGDLVYRSDLANNVDALKDACDQLTDCVAFNTNGYLKHHSIKPTNPFGTRPDQGYYMVASMV